MIVRKAQIQDIPAIAQVHVATWRTAYRGIIADSYLETLSPQRHIERHKRLMANPGIRYFVAEIEQNGIIGFLSGGPRRMDDMPFMGELYAIYLLHQHARQRTGAALIKAWARSLCEEGINSAYVWVLGDNRPAVAFYEKLGARFLQEQMIEIGKQNLRELAYGWDDLRALADA